MTYRVSLWDHETECWEPEAQGLSLWDLKRTLRVLYGRCYSSVSVLVEREELL